jgi:glutathione S-transferase
MPTTRPRHLITETDAVAQALDDAAGRWPADRGNRAKLLLHLLDEGHRAVSGQAELAAKARRKAVARTSGVLTGVYGAGYLAELRKDWPG